MTRSLALFIACLGTLLFLNPILARAQKDWGSSYSSIDELVAVLEKSKTGKQIIEKAKGRDPEIWMKIKLAESSYTESVFARSYSLLDGGEEIKIRHLVHLKKDLGFSDAVLDLAHELVHFNHKSVLDPYGAKFNLESFVRHGIEGEGGELEAFRNECLVSWELEQKISDFPKHSLCQPYKKDGSFAYEKAKNDYYAIGSWKLREEVRVAVPEVHRSKVIFTSSYASKPYPVALAEEYYATKQAACTNNQKKHRLIASQAESGRGLASIGQLQKEKERLERYNEEHCSD
ncbi:MAG: hypothetical protein M9962_00490 [Oligoflexia bacterium]|nr:hypothetical protein [Oligoflexia bacterium]